MSTPLRLRSPNIRFVQSEKLTQFTATNSRNGGRLSCRARHLLRLWMRLKTQLLAMLRAQSPCSAPSAQAPTRPVRPIPSAASQRATPTPSEQGAPCHHGAASVAVRTPWGLQRAMTADASLNWQKRSLWHWITTYARKARSDLTNPRTRLSAEWHGFPVSPAQSITADRKPTFDPMAVGEESGLPTLAHLDLLAAAFEAIQGDTMRKICLNSFGGCPPRE